MSEDRDELLDGVIPVGSDDLSTDEPNESSTTGAPLFNPCVMEVMLCIVQNVCEFVDCPESSPRSSQPS